MFYCFTFIALIIKNYNEVIIAEHFQFISKLFVAPSGHDTSIASIYLLKGYYSLKLKFEISPIFYAHIGGSDDTF